MKLVSWNVNGLRAVLNKNFNEVFSSLDADIFSIQETKCQPDQVTLDLAGYHQYFHSGERKGYASTAIFSKYEPINISYDFDADYPHPNEGRVMTLEFDKFYLVNAYVPNSKDGLLRLDYRMQWEDDLLQHLTKLDKLKPVIYCGDLKETPSPVKLEAKHKPIIYCGDLNVAYTIKDIANPDTNHFSPGFTDQERGKFQNLLNAGFVDTYRYLHPDKIEYSWWSYKTHARERNVGWRIDYFLVSDWAMPKVKESKILTDIYGSDHCPILLEIDI